MNISLTVESSSGTRPGAYRTDITITTASNDITINMFVKERTTNPDGSTDDTFVAVAGPADIEDLPELAPVAPSSLWRDSVVSLISSDPVKLATVTQEILNDLLLTIQQSNDLETFTNSVTYTIDSTSGITS